MSGNEAQSMSLDSAVVGVYQNRRFEGKEALDALSNTAPYCYGSPGAYPPGESITHLSALPSGPPATQAINCADPDPGATGCLGNWGLDRLDDYSLPRDGTFGYRETGTGVRIYIQDTGVLASHRELFFPSPPGRVEAGIDATQDRLPTGDPDCSQPAGYDAIGHGTHVTGIAGGFEFGVAKLANLVPVRQFAGVAPDHFLIDDFIITALECILADQAPNANTAIVNLSGLNEPKWAGSVPIQNAVIGVAARDNLLFVQAAGNFYPADACDHTYGNEAAFGGADAEAVARVLVVAGSDEADQPWTLAPGDGNPQAGTTLGPCVDLFAPAAHVVSSWWANTEEPVPGSAASPAPRCPRPMSPASRP